jgi:hypothetical protein
MTSKNRLLTILSDTEQFAYTACLYDEMQFPIAVQKVYFLHSLKVARAWPLIPVACRS